MSPHPVQRTLGQRRPGSRALLVFVVVEVVDARERAEVKAMSREQSTSLRRLTRGLEDSGAKLKDGTPIEYSKSYFRSDRIKFEVVITRSDKGDEGGELSFEL